MIISGVFIVNSLETKDSEGFETVALCHNQMEENLETRLYLPPYLRPSRCDIKAGSKVFGFADTTTGIGAALAGIDCDVTFTDKNNYHYTKTLTVDGACDFKDKLDVTKAITSSTGDIKANVGDVVATTVSLKNHKHPITIASFTGTIDPVSHAAEGSVTGGTDAPTP
jgi:hypothetical protein